MNSQLLQLADRIQAGLIQLGLSYEIKKVGMYVPVSFKDIQWVAPDTEEDRGPDYALLEVDMTRLPPKVSAPKLTKPDVLHHLTAVVGRPVYSLNTSGVTYCVDLRPPLLRRGDAAAQLPECVDYVDPVRGRRLDGVGRDHLALGVSRRGPLGVHPERLKNVLVVGAQGYGKSGLMRLLVYQALRAGWQLLLADPEGVTFNPHLWRGVEALIGGNVASSADEMAILLDLALEEIARRSELFSHAAGYPDSLEEYNAVAAAPLPRWGLFVDEANTYFADKGLVEGAAELARRGRKWGLHCVFAGHDWRANEIPRGMSGMLQTRVAFRVNDDTSGKVVLGRPGAEDLSAIPGRAIVRLDGYQLIQTYHLGKERLVNLVERQPRVAAPPTWDDLTRDAAHDEEDSDPLAERARAMRADGVSKRQIALRLYGGDGGAAWRKMEAALNGSTTTTTREGSGG